MNESLVKYLSGLLDADGSLSYSFKRAEQHGRNYLGLSLNLTASDAVDKHGFVSSLPEVTGMGSVSRYGDNKQFACWTVHKRADLEMLLPRLIKHMVIKAKHWQSLLDVWRDVRNAARKNGGSATVSDKERDFLAEVSRHSRKLRVGPIKPKNHPTWAWLAGYLDGDGWYSQRQGKNCMYMRVGAVAHTNDAWVLEFLRRSFGGSIKPHGQTSNCKIWYRSLGVRDTSFVLRFLPNLAKHSRLKRHKIDAMIHYHRQRLSDSGAAAQATV